jgi:hypothetical protein
MFWNSICLLYLMNGFMIDALLIKLNHNNIRFRAIPFISPYCIPSLMSSIDGFLLEDQTVLVYR